MARMIGKGLFGAKASKGPSDGGGGGGQGDKKGKNQAALIMSY